MGFNAARSEVTRQPETIPAGFEGNCNTFDLASCFPPFLTPVIEKLQQCALVDREPLRSAAASTQVRCRQRASSINSLRSPRSGCCLFCRDGTRSAQVLQLLHWGCSIGGIWGDGCYFLAAFRKGRCGGRSDVPFGHTDTAGSPSPSTPYSTSCRPGRGDIRGPGLRNWDNVLAVVKGTLRRSGGGLRPSLTAAARGVTLEWGRLGTRDGPRVETKKMPRNPENGQGQVEMRVRLGPESAQQLLASKAYVF
jgi:hypothetical protein